MCCIHCTISCVCVCVCVDVYNMSRLVYDWNLINWICKHVYYVHNTIHKTKMCQRCHRMCAYVCDLYATPSAHILRECMWHGMDRKLCAHSHVHSWLIVWDGFGLWDVPLQLGQRRCDVYVCTNIERAHVTISKELIGVERGSLISSEKAWSKWAYNVFGKYWAPYGISGS
jgi:hypothetical protein